MKVFVGLLAVLLLASFVFAVDTVVVSSDNEADVSAAEVAAGTNASLVTVEWGSESSDAVSKITALNPKKVIIIGGLLAIPVGLESKIKAKFASVERLNGEDRYETAALIAERFFANSSSAMLIQGDDPATIKAKVAEAKAAGIPILYMAKDGVPEKVKAKLKLSKIKEAKVEPSAETDDERIRAGLGNITADIRKVNKTEKALAQIAEAEEKIAKAKEMNITNSTNLAAQRMLSKADTELSLAKEALDAGKPGEAFGQAKAAESHAEAALKMSRNRNVGWYKQEADKVDAEVRAKGRDKVKADIDTESENSKVECGKKTVGGNVTRVCTTEKERTRAKAAVESKKEKRKSETKEVELSSFQFRPSTMIIRAGDTVEWANKDSVAHTVTSTAAPAGGEFDSGNLNKGEAYGKAFNITGTYEYQCSIHPNMKGKIIVN